ncbi:hypothetical protein B0T14DRAFT_519063 [Immersiella caudata]|uniref:Uncharacterized protein n=1 Tax=Immersiella caudata TaxID=314043 RepID=A0AA39WPR2_9PEZI|nr:hypothetical protein B0T14DRAFT_519063 [Immersiella caudata]
MIWSFADSWRECMSVPLPSLEKTCRLPGVQPRLDIADPESTISPSVASTAASPGQGG